MSREHSDIPRLIPIELWKWSGIKRRGNEKKTKERAAGTTENTGRSSVSKPCLEENNTIALSLLRIISSITGGRGKHSGCS